MKTSLSLRLKAALLLIVFSMNTVIGFACAIGFDMDFNSEHHHEGTEPHKHIHEKSEHHGHDKSHQHEQSINDQPGNEKDNCCHDKVINFEQLDKVVPSSVSIVFPVLFISLVTSYYINSLLPYTDVVKNIKPFVRSYHPPICDIRIAIQSFLI